MFYSSEITKARFLTVVLEYASEFFRNILFFSFRITFPDVLFHKALFFINFPNLTSVF